MPPDPHSAGVQRMWLTQLSASPRTGRHLDTFFESTSESPARDNRCRRDTSANCCQYVIVGGVLAQCCDVETWACSAGMNSWAVTMLSLLTTTLV